MLRNPLPFGRFLCLVLFVQFSTSSLRADTIVLKTGERLEAKIIKTTDTTVEAEVKMSSSVIDVRDIPLSDIATIEKPDPAEEAFAAVQAAGPGPNSLSPAQYNTAIHSHLNPFISKYPASLRATQAKAMIAALEKEKERVAFGEVKIENIWYSPADIEKQKDQITATLLLQQIKSLAQSGDTLGALNVFAQLEKNYPGARAYPSAVDYALKLIPNVQSDINTKKAIFANDMIERKKGLEFLPDFRKAPLIAAAAAEEAQADAALDTAIKAGTKWTSIYPRHQKSIDELQKTVTAEATRLSAIKTAPMHASIAAVAEARKKMTAGDFTSATDSLQKATTLWGTNLMIKEATAELTLAKATPTPTPSPSPTPALATPAVATPAAATTPSPTPAVAAPAIATPAIAATAIAAPAVGTPATPPVPPTPLPTTPVPAPSPAPSAVQAPSQTAPVPAEKPAFFTTIPGALAILGGTAVLAIAISLGMKARNKKNTSSVL